MLLVHVTDTLPLRDELLCRTAMFVSKCVDSENNTVKFVSRHGVYFTRVSLVPLLGLMLSYAVRVLICLCVGLHLSTKILCGVMYFFS